MSTSPKTIASEDRSEERARTGASGSRGTSLIDRVRERLAAEALSSLPLRPNVVAAAIRAESGGVLGDAEVLSSLRVLQTELTGAGILEPLLCADGVTDVLVTAPDAVWVDDGNGLRRSSIRFADDAAVRRLAQRLALAAGRRLDEAQPWVDGQLTGLGTGQFTVRLHAVLPPIAAGGTCLSLRVLRPASQDLAALTATGTIAPQPADLLDAIIRARLAFLISGGTGAGKTTLLAATLGAVPSGERIVCVEDAPELAPRHPHLVKLVARCANVEGVGEVTVRDLVKQALRMRPDRIVVGEVRGAEVVDLLAALNTGHDGGAGTVHANNPAEVPARLEALAALGGLDRAALHSQLAAAVQVVLHVSRGRTGRRRLNEIAVLQSEDGGRVRSTTAWHADTGFGCGADHLRTLLRDRGQS
jgi:pilus assembly protein CpaF